MLHQVLTHFTIGSPGTIPVKLLIGGSWTTVSIPASVLNQPDFSLVDAEFGMAFEGADTLLNFAIDNVRFEER